MEINLVSDTVTKPTYEMLYMFNAQWVTTYKQDPTVIELESSLYYVWHGSCLVFLRELCINQTILHTARRIIPDKYAHVYLYEGGGALYGVSFVY
jgi:threonine aldolase